MVHLRWLQRQGENRNEIPFDQLSLEVEYEQVERPRRIGSIQATIHIAADLPEDRKRALLGVARHSSVANTLARHPEISFRFAEEGGK